MGLRVKTDLSGEQSAALVISGKLRQFLQRC